MPVKRRDGRDSGRCSGDRIAEPGPGPIAGPQLPIDNAMKDAEDFIKALREETAAIGKNRIELKMMAIEKAAAAVAGTKLEEQIRAEGKAWREATNANAVAELKRDLAEQGEALAFDTKLLGMNARERAVAIAQREIEAKIVALQKQGIEVGTAAIEAETAAIIANATARGQRELDVENARAYTAQIRDMNDALRETVAGFGQLLGTAGAGFEALINTMTDYADRRADLQQRIAEADERTAEGQRERERATAELARAEVTYYGDILGAAKRMFKEKSVGYRVLEGIEKAYRAYQAASMIIEMVNTARSILFDNAKTASSVANSATRASADGVAAIAKAIASLPFPFNIVAGAATAAALVAFGVKLLGGGSGKSASAASEAEAAKQPVYSGPVDEYGQPTSSYSVLRPGQTRTGEPATSAPGARSGGCAIFAPSPTYNIRVEGGANDDTIAQIRAELEDHEERVVERTRQAVAEDFSERQTRQRIGGAG